MAIVKKKIWPESFDAVASGKKKAEFRVNDFEINEGDTLVLEEWDPKTKQYTGRKVEKKVSHVIRFKLDRWGAEQKAILMDKGAQLISLE